MLWWYLPLEALVLLVAQQALAFSPVHAVMAFVVAAAVTVLLVDLPSIPPPRWPRIATVRRDGTRDQISALSWAFMTRDESVSTRGLLTVRETAATRLALHGIDLADPAQEHAVRNLLGDTASVLLSQDGRPPTMAQVGRCIDRIATISPSRPQPQPSPLPLPQPPSQSPRTP